MSRGRTPAVRDDGKGICACEIANIRYAIMERAKRPIKKSTKGRGTCLGQQETSHKDIIVFKVTDAVAGMYSSRHVQDAQYVNSRAGWKEVAYLFRFLSSSRS